MGLMRGIAIFLIGLGTAIGAQFAGVFDGIPYRLHRQSYMSELPPPDLPPGAVIDMEPSPGMLPESGASVVQVTYQPARNDPATGCVPRYAFYNRTGRPILFSARDDRDGGGTARIDPGSTYTPVADKSGDAYAGDYDADSCSAGIVSIQLDDARG